MRRVAVGEAFSVPEVWAPCTPDKIKIFHKNAERVFGVSPAPTSSGVLS